MRPTPRLSQDRRAGLLAAVAVYPMTRLAGTLPRPALDGALISGVAMSVAYGVASTTTQLSRRLARSEQHPGRAGLGAATVAAGLAVGAGYLAVRARREARARAAEGRRIEIRPGAVGSAAELVAVGAGASSLVAFAEGIGAKLPGPFRPEHPAAMSLGVAAGAAAVAIVARDTRVSRYVTLQQIDPDAEAVARFLPYERLPVALGRAVVVAGASVTALILENKAVDALAGWVDKTDDPGPLARLGGHLIIGSAAVAAGLAGFAFYSSRVVVEERILESAYAAVPERSGLSGGPSSAYSFEDLGREGRRFVSQAYTADELEAVLGRPAAEPVRAFVPLHSLTDDPAADAEQMISELEALGAFDRGVLVLAAPTGDGYVSYVFSESVELLTGGDCAIVAMPYAEVPSAVALPRRRRAAEAHAVYARTLATAARTRNPSIRLFLFGESLGSIVTLDAFGPDLVDELTLLGYSGGLYVGVPILCRTDQKLRPRDPRKQISSGLQYVHSRADALSAHPGHVNLTHSTDPTAVGDASTLVRHPVDYWKRPGGAHIPVVSFLVNLADVKNAMNLRPGEFHPSLGHDYRFETAAAVSSAFHLAFDDEEVVEHALRERELAWSIRRLLSRRIGEMADSAKDKLRDWGVDPDTLGERFASQRRTLSAWLSSSDPDAVDVRDATLAADL